MEFYLGYLWLLLICIVTIVRGEIRCFCNQAACVTTSYMCKAAVGLCYTEGGAKGCVVGERSGCGKGRRLCCTEDMCNYGHPDYQPTSDAFEDPPPDDEYRVSLAEAQLRREVWFRAAVIAVPVAGVCVLALLAAAAARMLRQDANARQRRLVELRRIYNHSLLVWQQKEKGVSIV